MNFSFQKRHPSGTVQSKLTHSIFKSFNIKTTYLFLWSRVVDVCEIKIDKYRPCDSMSPLFTSEIRQPPTSEHPVSLGVVDISHFASFLFSFSAKWSFSYLTFTKYITNIIAGPKYKYGQQEQTTVRNHNSSHSASLDKINTMQRAMR